MYTTTQIAKHLREVYFGGNWTASNLRKHLVGVTWEEATTQIESFNSIATLVFHMHYYVKAATKVLEGGPLVAKDALSFNHPPINSGADWQAFLEKTWEEAETFAERLEALPDTSLPAPFTNKVYGSYYRNLHGIIEHCHYHLGQIVLLKKLLQTRHESCI